MISIMWQDKFKRLPWPKLLAFVLALLLWQMAAMAVGEAVFLAAPTAVLMRLFSLLTEGGLFPVLLFSLCRVLVGFLAGLVLGCLLAVLAARFSLLATLLYPYMITVRSVPVASFIVLALLWFSSGVLSGLISFLIVLPVVYNSLLAALTATDRRLDEMATVFAIPFFARLRCIYVPQVRPALLSAAATSMGLAWKSGVAAELFGLPDGSIGLELYRAKLYLDTPALFAWTLVIVLSSLVCEKLVAALLRTLLGGWRI